MRNPSPPPASSRRGRALLRALAVAAVVAAIVLAARRCQRPPDHDDGAAPPVTVRSDVEPALRTAPDESLPLAERIAAALAGLDRPRELAWRVLDADEQPVAQPRLHWRSRFAPPGDPAIEPRTDADDRAVVRLELPGRWLALDALAIDAPGCALRRLPPGMPPAGVAEPETVRLPRGASLEGRVAGGGGEPLAGCEVTLHPSPRDARARLHDVDLVLARATTDADGRFAFRQVGEGRVRVEVAGPEGFALAVVADAATGARPLAIALETAAPALGGSVLDPAGNAIAGARILASDVRATERCGELAASDAQGAFALRRLAKGYYTLDVVAPGFAPARLARAHSGTLGVPVVLEPLAAARLEIAGAPAGRDVPVAWRPLKPEGDPRRPAGPFAWATLRDGKLNVPEVPLGRFALELRVPGAAPLETSAVEFCAGSTTELGRYELAAGATLRARVVDAQGRPVAARAVLAARFLGDRAARLDLFGPVEREEARIGRDGAFEWPALPAGPRTLALRAAGCADRNLTFVAPERGVVDLGTLALADGGAVEGFVRSPDGRPRCGAVVVAAPIGGAARETTSDVDGRYRFDHLPAGRVEVSVLPQDEAAPPSLAAALAGAAPQSALLDVEPGTATRRDFTAGG